MLLVAREAPLAAVGDFGPLDMAQKFGKKQNNKSFL